MGVSAKIAAIFGKAVFSPTTTVVTDDSLASSRNGRHGKPGASVARSAGLMGL